MAKYQFLRSCNLCWRCGDLLGIDRLNQLEEREGLQYGDTIDEESAKIFLGKMH